METIEGDIRIGARPVVTIGDKLVRNCEPDEIAHAIITLVKKIGEQREKIIRLNAKLAEKNDDAPAN